MLSYSGIRKETLFQQLFMETSNLYNITFLLNEIESLKCIEELWFMIIMKYLQYDNCISIIYKHCEHFQNYNVNFQKQIISEIITTSKGDIINLEICPQQLCNNFKINKRNELKCWKLLKDDNLKYISSFFDEHVEIRLLCFKLAYCKQRGH